MILPRPPPPKKKKKNEAKKKNKQQKIYSNILRIPSSEIVLLLSPWAMRSVEFADGELLGPLGFGVFGTTKMPNFMV